MENPFKPGDRVRMVGVPAGVADVTVTALGVCEDGECGQPTIHFVEAQTREPVEAHASDFEAV